METWKLKYGPLDLERVLWMSLPPVPEILQKSARLDHYMFAQNTLYIFVFPKYPIAQDATARFV
jgi:hypothetical protein